MSILDTIRKEKQKVSRSSEDDMNVVRFKDGKNIIRPLPNPVDQESGIFAHSWGQHWIKGLEPNENGSYIKAVVPCAKSTFGEDCPICNALGKGIMEATTDEQIKALEGGKAGTRFLMWGLNLSKWSEDPTVPVLWEMPKSVYGQILEAYQSAIEDTDDGEGYNPLSLKDGMDFMVKKEGTGLNTKYVALPLAKSKPVPSGVMDKISSLEDMIKKQFDDVESNTRAFAAISAVAGLELAATSARPKAIESVTTIDAEEVTDDDIPFETSSDAKSEPVTEEDISTEDIDELLSDL